MTEPSEIPLPGDDVPAVLGPAFSSALQWVAHAHRDQHRKGKPTVPYVSHLIGVASLVLEAGGTETEAVAALLHDAIEDQDITASDIRHWYGARVEEIVVACTDNVDDDAAGTRGTANWHARKESYLSHLEDERDAGILLVTGADKLHNARAMVADLRTGELAWTTFNAPPADQLWYYGSLRDVFRGRIPEYIDQEFQAAVAEIVRLTEVPVESAAWFEAHPST